MSQGKIHFSFFFYSIVIVSVTFPCPDIIALPSWLLFEGRNIPVRTRASLTSVDIPWIFNPFLFYERPWRIEINIIDWYIYTLGYIYIYIGSESNLVPRMEMKEDYFFFIKRDNSVQLCKFISTSMAHIWSRNYQKKIWHWRSIDACFQYTTRNRRIKKNTKETFDWVSTSITCEFFRNNADASQGADVRTMILTLSKARLY